ncbi:hypothetical protein C4568_03885 [Candidatus Parcubacteria bacterium]|nr:MAG: hypothetical protein C4568_03885 [Candidatus Parcubacteria bacterium]
MNTKLIVGLVAVLLVALGGYYLVTDNTSAPTENMPPESMNEPTTSAGMRAEENMIVVNEQKPGAAVTASAVVLADTGFVVIHEDTNGAAGAILGASALLQAGESMQVPVSLSRATVNGEKLHAMLHADTDGNGTFDAAIDMPVQSRMGGALEGWFEINAEAPDLIPVSI